MYLKRIHLIKFFHQSEKAPKNLKFFQNFKKTLD